MRTRHGNVVNLYWIGDKQIGRDWNLYPISALVRKRQCTVPTLPDTKGQLSIRFQCPHLGLETQGSRLAVQREVESTLPQKFRSSPIILGQGPSLPTQDPGPLFGEVKASARNIGQCLVSIPETGLHFQVVEPIGITNIGVCCQVEYGQIIGGQSKEGQDDECFE